MITVDVIKAAYRQTKDGFAVTFVIHPQDEHDELALALIGTPGKITWEPLDKDGNASDEGLPTANEIRGILKEPSRLTQLAGIACNDPLFWKFLTDEYEYKYIITNRDQARDAVYELCDVDSRKEFIVGTPAGDRWLKLYDAFALWRDAPEAAE